MTIQHRSQATISLARLERNIRNMQSRLDPGVEMIAVVKADSYGHGAAGLYPTFRACGVERFAVALWEEGAELRRAGATDCSILILGDTRDEDLQQLLTYRLTPTIFSVETAEKLNTLASAAGVVHPIHIKLDTGMSRIGFAAESSDTVPSILRIAAMEHLRIEGMFTHFPRADELDAPETDIQYDRFCTVADKLAAAGLHIPLLHAANSATVLLRKGKQLNAVRVGDSLYGICPVDEDVWPQFGLEPVLRWDAGVTHVKTVPAGTQVGYGGTYITTRPTVIATIPVGYADGYNRALSNRGHVFIRGENAPIIGRVCMDQFMVDVTHIPGVQRGDVAELVGPHITLEQMANTAGITPDEIVCCLNKRLPRVYSAE